MKDKNYKKKNIEKYQKVLDWAVHFVISKRSHWTVCIEFSIILPEVKSRLFFLALHHKEIICWRTLKLNTIKIFFLLFHVWWCNSIKSTTFFRCCCFNTNWLDEFIKIFWLIQLNGWMKTWFLPFNNRKLNKYQIHWISVLFVWVLDFVIRGISLYEKQKQKKTIFLPQLLINPIFSSLTCSTVPCTIKPNELMKVDETNRMRTEILNIVCYAACYP